MTSNAKQIATTLGAALALASAFLIGSGRSVRAQSEQSAKGLEGTWRVTITQRQFCPAGPPLGNSPIQSLLAFARGGTLSGTTGNQAFLPGQRSADFGIWSGAGRDYSAFSEAFVIFSGGPFTQGSQTIRHSISLTDDGTGFTDIAAVQFLDVNGHPVAPTAGAPGCATAIGQRIQ
jgi:hypothetical protein